MAEKLIMLADAFRAILRAAHSQRPALADEIQSYRYFHSAKVDKKSGRRIDPEVQAADDALAILKDAIVNQSVRLRGRVGSHLPDDIDPTEVVRTGIGVLDNILEVYEPSTRTTAFRVLRTYRNVHCYASEIAALVDPQSSSARSPKRVATKRTAAEDAVKACYPKGVPDAVEVPDGPLCKEIAGWLRANRPALANMSDKTILRAAGRAI